MWVLAFVIAWPAAAQTCATGRTSPALTADRWTMIALPCAPQTATVEGVWADDFGAENYDNPGVPDNNPTWVVWEWNEATGTYLHLALTDTLGGAEGVPAQHQGYWILNTLGGAWTVQGSETRANRNGSPCGGLLFSICFEVALTAPPSGTTMHLLANPHPVAVPWSLVLFGDDVDLLGFPGATAEIFSMIVNTFYSWNGAAYQSFSDGNNLPPFASFWLEVGALPNWDPFVATIQFPVLQGLTAGADRQLPAAPPTPSAHGRQPRPEPAAGEWEVRLVVATPDDMLEDPGNHLGQLAGAVDGFNYGDLKALDPFTTPYLDLVFPHPDWEEHAADYNRDYHDASGAEMDVWQFVVKSDDPDRDVVLSWEGDRLMNRMWLRDELTGELVKAVRKGELQTYAFNMGGATERSFSWALAPVR